MTLSINQNIQIFCNKPSERLRYVCDFIFDEYFGVSYSIVTDQEMLDSNIPIIYYQSGVLVENSISIPVNGLLKENGINDFVPNCVVGSRFPMLFPTNDESKIPFDIFSATFYLLSRYEEYNQPEEKFDEHGRFKAEESLAFVNGFLGRPLIDEWMVYFRTVLEEFCPNLSFKERSFQSVVTIDVDTAFAFAGRSLVYTYLAVVKDMMLLRFKRLFQRFLFSRNPDKDPYNTFSFITDTLSQFQSRCILFLHVGNRSDKDNPSPYYHSHYQALMNTLRSKCQLAWHPSYASHQFEALLYIEKERIEKVIKSPIKHARFHYLKFDLPKSHQKIRGLGIEHDYSMSYAGFPGFRASTCQPFLFYDLKEEKATNLRIHPFPFMELSFEKYQRDSYEKAFETMCTFIDLVKKYKGVLYTTWHNDSFSNPDWKKVFEQTMKYIHRQ
jgi:hypothetical protein